VICILSGNIELASESSASKMWTSDRVGRQFVGLAASITFASLRNDGVDCSLVDTLSRRSHVGHAGQF